MVARSRSGQQTYKQINKNLTFPIVMLGYSFFKNLMNKFDKKRSENTPRVVWHHNEQIRYIIF
jgi:hypothetical protein